MTIQILRKIIIYFIWKSAVFCSLWKSFRVNVPMNVTFDLQLVRIRPLWLTIRFVLHISIEKNTKFYTCGLECSIAHAMLVKTPKMNIKGSGRIVDGVSDLEDPDFDCIVVQWLITQIKVRTLFHWFYCKVHFQNYARLDIHGFLDLWLHTASKLETIESTYTWRKTVSWVVDTDHLRRNIVRHFIHGSTRKYELR